MKEEQRSEIDKQKKLDYIEFVMDQMRWKQVDLFKMGMGQKSHISEMLNGKRGLTKAFIKKFTEKSHRKQMAWMLL